MRRRTALVVTVAAVFTLVAGGLTLPRPPQPSTDAIGDAALSELLAEALERNPGALDAVSIAVVDDNGVRYSGVRSGPDTEFEIGSVTKTFTAALLADSLNRGEVTPGQPLGELLDLGTSPAASITLEQLATHTSGLPRLPLTVGTFVGALWSQFSAGDPYTADVDRLVSQARAATPGETGTVEYSNFGMALLGQALAAAADTEYSTLVTERITGPLGMDASYLPVDTSGLARDAPTGYTASGRSAKPWTLKANAPAGGLRSTATDMALYARALLEGTAPGIDALDPTTDAGGGDRIGYAWFTSTLRSSVTGEEASDRLFTWHNGMTGGYAAFIGLDFEADRAIVVMSNTAATVDTIGVELLEAAR